MKLLRAISRPAPRHKDSSGQNETGLVAAPASSGRASAQACSRKEKNRRVHRNPLHLCLTGLFLCQIGSTYLLTSAFFVNIFLRFSRAFDRFDLEAPTDIPRCLPISSCDMPSITNRLNTVL